MEGGAFSSLTAPFWGVSRFQQAAECVLSSVKTLRPGSSVNTLDNETHDDSGSIDPPPPPYTTCVSMCVCVCVKGHGERGDGCSQ